VNPGFPPPRDPGRVQADRLALPLVLHPELAPGNRPGSLPLHPGTQAQALAEAGWRGHDRCLAWKTAPVPGSPPRPLARFRHPDLELPCPARLIVHPSGCAFLADMGRPAPEQGRGPGEVPARLLRLDPRGLSATVLSEGLLILDLCVHPDGERLLALTIPERGSKATELAALSLSGRVLERRPIHRPEHGGATLAMRLAVAGERLRVVSHATSRLLSYDLENFRLADEFEHFFLRMAYDLAPAPAGGGLAIPTGELDTVLLVDPEEKRVRTVQRPGLVAPACLEPRPGPDGGWLCLHASYLEPRATALSVLDADFAPRSTRPLDAVWPLHGRVADTPEGPRLLLVDPRGGLALHEVP
jgi:hypothetical protein